MAVITLKNCPDPLHIKVRQLQLDLEKEGIKKSLENLYIELIEAGLNQKG
jgi:hypothetical protein